MKTLAAFALFVSACAASVRAAAPPAPPADSTGVDAVKRVAQDMGTAMVARDVGALDRIYADDSATIAMSGRVVTKKDLLTNFESFHDTLVSFENGPIDVQVFGGVAVSQGTVHEKRTRDGKDTSGDFAWMDLLESREGRWQVVRSAAARLADGVSFASPSADPNDADALLRVEKRAGDAMLTADVDTLADVYAEHWLMVDASGKLETKEGLLSQFTSGRQKLVAYELGTPKVQVLGDVAMFQAGVVEKRIRDGKDVSGHFVFMDLLKNRAGKWVIIRTLGARAG